MTNKIENQCATCDEMATTEILDEVAIDYLGVCDDCYKEIFINVANGGSIDFYDWALAMYGKEKAVALTEDIFGANAQYLDDEDEEVIESFNSGEKMLMFTYGILKYPSNLKREGASYIVENCTIKGHSIHLYANSFPVTSKTGNDKDIVYGTLFETPKYMVLSQYDMIEGYNPKGNADRNMYNREEIEVTLPSGEVKVAQMYYANQRQFATNISGYTRIPTGNFDDKQLAQSYHSQANARKKKGKM